MNSQIKIAIWKITPRRILHTALNLKLLRFELPKFNDDVLKFQNLGDQFKDAVQNNVDLPNVQKFTYLRSVQTGNA